MSFFGERIDIGITDEFAGDDLPLLGPEPQTQRKTRTQKKRFTVVFQIGGIQQRRVFATRDQAQSFRLRARSNPNVEQVSSVIESFR